LAVPPDHETVTPSDWLTSTGLVVKDPRVTLVRAESTVTVTVAEDAVAVGVAPEVTPVSVMM
jgi:hypothetical protein